MLFSIFGLGEKTSVLLAAVLITFLATAVVFAVVVFILFQKGMIRFSRATRTIFGRPKDEPELPLDTPAVVPPEELKPLKITVIDMKEERRKFETAQRSAIKPEKPSRPRRLTKGEKDDQKLR